MPNDEAVFGFLLQAMIGPSDGKGAESFDILVCSRGCWSAKIDTSSAAGELIFRVFGAIAHLEHRLIAERTKDGIAATRARGKRQGRQTLNQDRVAAALKLVAAGLSPTAAARQIGLGRSTVYREVSPADSQRST